MYQQFKNIKLQKKFNKSFLSLLNVKCTILLSKHLISFKFHFFSPEFCYYSFIMKNLGGLKTISDVQSMSGYNNHHTDNTFHYEF